MTLQDFAATALLTVSGLLGVHPIATETGDWRTTQAWKEIAAPTVNQGSFMEFKAESSDIPKHCQSQPDAYVAFPAIIHGSHIIKLDGHTILKFGDPTFQTMRSFYGQPVLTCRDLAGGQILQWEAYSYTKYFARISSFPVISSSRPFYNVFAETFHIIGAGAGLLMAIFTFTIFAGKVSRETTLAVCISSLFSSFYLGGCVAGFMGFPYSMLTMHKVADIGVWISICSLVRALQYENLVSGKVFRTYLGSVIIAVVMIVLGSNGDLVQFGTTIPFMFTLGVLSVPMVRLGRKLITENTDRRTVMQFFSLGSFVLATFNEMFAVTGLIHSSPMLPFGFMGGVMFLALSVNERVNATYLERDYLRSNLEQEVESQTKEIKKKTQLLETAMLELKTTQAELVQSAKLASLGTLSAGIAHEINNSLNYVNGAMQPLEKLIDRSALPQDKEKINKLLRVMKDGLNLTLEIIKSLRTYTGLNQAKFNDVKLENVINSSLTILRNRIGDKITVHCEVPKTIYVFGSVVGLNQICMNLISNAVDAMADGGTLTITARLENDCALLTIQDTGKGIAKENMARIFEPFFTTKEVGRGTGLGLHIVKQEVERQSGRLSVTSDVGVGTSFEVVLPCKMVESDPSAEHQRKVA